MCIPVDAACDRCKSAQVWLAWQYLLQKKLPQGHFFFICPLHLFEVHQQLRALMEKDANLATTTTLANIRATRTWPPTCPDGYYSLLQIMMCLYIRLLMMMFVSACEHMTSVTTIHFLIQEPMATFQLMNKTQVAHLLWAIFMDA